ncbi:MAG: YadA-like family protein [Gammaproteobacteria bacterium]|nr:YadA-like family protein [Gammaproteobacteria bacterium]
MGDVDMNGEQIHGVVAGTAGTDAVNVDQLKAARTTITNGKNITSVNSVTDADTGAISYTIDAEDTTAKVLSDSLTVTTPAIDEARGDKTVTDYKIELKDADKKRLEQVDTNTGDITKNKQGIADNKTALGNKLEADDIHNVIGDGITVSQPNLVDNDITLSITDGAITTDKLANNAVTEDKIANALVDEFKAKSVEDVKGVADEIVVNQTKQDANDENRTFTVGLAQKVKDQIAANAKGVTDVANLPLTFSGDSGANVDRKLGTTVQIKGGETNPDNLTTTGNIGVVANGQDTLDIRLAKDIDLGNEGSISIGTDGPSINKNGIDMRDKQITNLKAGTEGNHAVNLDQLKEVDDKAVKNAGDITDNANAITALGNKTIKLTGDTGSTDTQTLNSNIEFDIEGANGIETVASTDKVVVKLDKTTKDKIDNAADKNLSNITKDGKKAITDLVDIENGENTVGTATVDANGKKTFKVDVQKSPIITDADAGTASTDDADKLATAGDVVNAVNNSFWKTTAGGNLDGKATEEQVKAGETVQFDAGKNLKVKQTGQVFEFKTADEVEFDKVEVDGVTIDGGKITGLQPGEVSATSTDAVSGSQLNAVKDAAAQPLTFTGDEGSTERKLGQTFEIVAGNATATSTDNLKTKVEDGKVTISMADAPTFKGKVTAKGVDAGGEKITNVAAGDVSATSTDAVNGSQLDAVDKKTVKNAQDITALENHNLKFIANTDETDPQANNTDKTFEILGENGLTTVAKGRKVTVKIDAETKGKIDNAADKNLSNITKAGKKVITNLVTIENGVNTTASERVDDATGVKTLKVDVVTGEIEDNPNGTVASKAGDENKVAKVSDVASAINSASHKLKNKNTDLSVTADASQTAKIKAGSTITIEAGKNLVSSLDEDGLVQISTAKEVEFDKVTVGTASIDKDDGINAGGKQIKGVASGLGSTALKDATGETLTNAANIGDLKNVSDALTTKGLKFAGDDATEITKALGDKLEITGGATKTNLTENNIGVNSNGQNLVVQLAKDVKGLNSVVLGDDATDKDTVALTTGGINAGNKKITNVAEGKADTDAVNVKQLKDAAAASKTTVKSLDEEKITATAVPQADGSTRYDLNIVTSDISTDSNGTVGTPAKPNALVTAGNVAEAIKNAGWNLQENSADKDLVQAGDTVNFVDNPDGATTVAITTTANKVSEVKVAVETDDKTIQIESGKVAAKTTAITTTDGVASAADGDALLKASDVVNAINNSSFTVNSDNAEGKSKQEVKAGNEVKFNAGKNMKLTQAGKTFTYATKDDVTFNSVVVGDVNIANDKVTIGDTVVEDGKATVGNIVIDKDSGMVMDGKGITNLKSGLDGTPIANATGDKLNNAVNVGDLKTVAKGLTDAGLQFGANDGDDKTNKLGSKVTVKGKGETVWSKSDEGKNVVTKITQTNGNTDITVALAKDLEVDSVTTGENVLDATEITVDGKKETNVSEAINKTAAQAFAPLTFKGDDNQTVAKKLTETVEIVGGADKTKLTDDNIGVNVKNGKIEIKLAKDVNLGADGSMAVGGVVTDGATNTIKGLSNKDFDPDNFVSGQAATEDQLKQVSDVANKGFKLTTSKSDGEVEGTTLEQIQPDETVTIDAGKNIKIKQTANKISVATKAEVEFDKVTVGTASIDKDTGINAGNKEIKGVAPGTTDDAAVNKKQLDDQATALTNKGLNFIGDDNNKVHRNLGETLNIVGESESKKLSDSNIGVISEKDDELKIKLAKELTQLTSAEFVDAAGNETNVDAAGVIISPDQKAGKQSVRLTINGLDNGLNKIVNVADGEVSADSKDAINGSQLDKAMKAAKTEVVSKDTNKVTISEKTPEAADGHTTYEVDIVTHKLVIDTATGTVTEPQGDDAEKLVTAGDIANVVNNASFKVKANGDAGEQIKAGDEVEFVNGDNIEIVRDGGKFTIGTAKDVSFDTVTAKKGLTVGEGDKATSFKPTDTTALDANEQSTDKTPALDMGGATFTGLAHNLVPAATKKSLTAPAKVVETNAATVRDVMNAGWNLQNNGDAKDFVTPYETVNFINGAGTTAVVESNNGVSTVKFDINKGTVDADANTGGPATGTDGFVTGKQVADAMNKSGFKLKTKAGDGELVPATTKETGYELINPSEEVTVEAGKNIKVAQTNGVINIATKDDVEFDNVTAKKGLTIGEGDKAIGFKPTDTTALDANEQSTDKTPALDMGGATFTGLAHNLVPTATKKSQAAPTKVTETNAATVRDVMNSGWNLQVGGEAKDFVKAYDTVNFEGDDNIKVEHLGGDTANTIKISLKKGDVNSGGTTGNGDGTATGDKGFVTGEQVADAINKSGFKLTAQGQGESLVNPGESVDMKNTDGNIVISKKADSNDVNYDLAEKVKVKTSLTIADIVSIDKDGINAGGKKITNVADGEISATSKDAINGSQLSKAKTELQKDIKDIIDDLGEVKDNPITFTGDNGKSTKRKLGETLKVTGDGKNISTKVTEGQVSVTMKDDPTFNTVQIGGANGPKIQATKDGSVAFTKKDPKTGKDVLTTIKAAPGKGPNDVATVGQMNQVANNMKHAIGKVADDANAGAASGIATANLPQPHDPGASMVSAAVGHYQGKQALAVGISSISDNGKWIIKGSLSEDTQRNFGAGVGIGYQW